MWNGKPVNEKLVLVVDDERVIRRSISRLLGMNGYCVMEAENGEQALGLLEEASHFPGVILLDLGMPIMDGYRFLRIRAQQPMLRRIPVVVVSGDATAAEPLDGVDVCLHKPVSFERLIEVIRTASG
jgi:CheY-like chemotaxis protein